MKAVMMVPGPNGATMEVRDVPEPEPGSREALVAVRATALNRGEIVRRRGLTTGDAAISGIECAGEVVAIGAQVSHTRYAFRRHPWSSKHTFAFGWAFEAQAPRIAYRGQFRPENSRLLGEVALRYSSLDLSEGILTGGEQSSITAALNWYPNPVTRLMVNYVLADVKDVGDVSAVVVRSQIDF